MSECVFYLSKNIAMKCFFYNVVFCILSTLWPVCPESAGKGQNDHVLCHYSVFAHQPIFSQSTDYARQVISTGAQQQFKEEIIKVKGQISGHVL